MYDDYGEENVYQIDVLETQNKRKQLFQDKMREKKEKEKMLTKYKITGDYFQVTRRLI